MLPIPSTEAARLARLAELDILDTAAEPSFDALVQTASAVCRCPISLMSLVDVDRQWFKAAVGLDVAEMPREHAFCAHAIHDDVLFEVPDALLDARFVDNPLVRGDLGIRYYAGQPIVHDGVPLGTLCVVDRVPRRLDDEQKRLLAHLSTVLAELLHGRLEAIAHRREAARLRAFADLSGDWLWETDVLHRCTWISGDRVQAAGVFEGDVIGRRVRDADVVDWVGRRTADGALALFDRGVAFADAIVATDGPDGTRYVALTAEPMVDADGEATGFRGSARDVTAALRVELQLREREALLHNIAGQVPGFIYQYRQYDDGTVCYPFASEGIRDVYELSPDDVLTDGAIVFSRIHPDDVAAIHDSIRVSRTTNAIWHMRYRVVLPRKGLRWLQGSSVPERLADGSTVWHGYITDVTDSHARDRELESANAALRRTERRLVALTDNLPALICEVGLDGRYRFANAAYRDWFGFDHRAMVGRRIDDYFDAAALTEMRPYIERARAGERVAFERRATIGGRERHLLVAYVPDRGDDGRVVGVYAMTTDVTERRVAELRSIASEQRLRDVTDNVPALIAQFDMDERCVFANRTALAMHGVARDALDTLTFGSHIAPSLYAQHREALDHVLAGRRATVHGSHVLDGHPMWFKAQLTPDFDDRGVQRGFYLVTVDVTTLKVAELERTRSEERLRELTDALPVLIAYIDADRRMAYVNETFRAWIGLDRAQLIGRDVLVAIGADLYAERRAYLERCFAGERVSFRIHSVVAGVERHLQTTYLPDFGPDGIVVGITTLSVDITDRVVAEERLSRLAHSDPLTGLPNRLHFDDELAVALASCREGGASIAVMFLDVDRFKSINDGHGHAVGDQVLQEFGRRLVHAVRRTDFVARLAGDEFVVIVRHLQDPGQAARIATKIVAAVGDPFQTDAGPLAITTSIGVAVPDAGSRTPAALLAKADAALYRAKNAGRNTYRLAA